MLTKFYYHWDPKDYDWDRDKQQARLVVGHVEYFVDYVVCLVSTHTEQNKEFPHFVVSGKCEECKIFNGVAILK